ncbi:MAG: UDP-4-amino-4,6-dideoxy-N-acetyl-beta-L-altrosamine transaminase [Pseudomonadota bacterium]
MSAEPPFLPYGRHTIEADDIAAVSAVLKSDFLTTGPAVDAFETAFAAATGARHAVALSSGTAALHLATLALGLGPGDAVVVPSITFVATANVAELVGADVLFADVDADTGLMTPATLEAALARRGDAAPRAVYPVHLNGQSADMAGIKEVADRHGLRIVEDACHALGGTAHDRPVGGCVNSDMAMFSLHPVKTIAMGEGGVLTTNDDDLAASLRGLRNHGLVRDAALFENGAMAFDAEGDANPWYYELHAPAFNYRASDIHCALGTSQLSKLERFVGARHKLADIYDEALTPLAPQVRPVSRVCYGSSGWHLYAVLIDFDGIGKERAAVMHQLRQSGIGTQVHYIPVHRQPYYRERHGNLDLPGADAYYGRCLSLPLYPTMTNADVARVVAALREATGRH